MRRKRFLYAVLFIAALSTISIIKTYATETSMPGGTVVIGSKAFALDYANDSKNISEINLAIVTGGNIYIKNYGNNWVDNATSTVVNASIIPSVTYKGSTGIVSNYIAGDVTNNTPVDTTPLSVISIE